MVVSEQKYICYAPDNINITAMYIVEKTVPSDFLIFHSNKISSVQRNNVDCKKKSRDRLHMNKRVDEADPQIKRG